MRNGHCLGMLFCMVLSSSILILSFPAYADSKYVVIDIESLAQELQESEYTVAYAINNSGQVIIYSFNYDNSRGFIVNKPTDIEDLGNLGGDAVQPIDINENGQVVGRAKLPHPFGQYNPFIWDPVNGMEDLGTMGESTYGNCANAINDNGEVVGYLEPSTGRYAFLWDPENGMRELDENSLYNQMYSARAINNFGEVAGYINWPYNSFFIWDKDNGIQEIGTFDKNSAIPNEINDSGNVVGNNCTAPYLCSAFLWNKENGKIDLGALGSSSLSWAEAINDVGEIVGNSPYVSDWKAQRYAFIWSNGTMEDLNDLIPSDSGWILENATDINDKGQIVGWGWHNDKKKAFLLNPAIEIIEVKISLRPRVLILKSRSNRITSFIKFPDDYDLDGVLFSTISIEQINGYQLSSPIYPIRIYKFKKPNNHFDIMCKFNRQEIIPLLNSGVNEITISGDSWAENPFQGSSTIRLITKRKRPIPSPHKDR